MNCRQLRNLINELTEGTLPPRKVAAAGEHITMCPACRQALERERAVFKSLSTHFQKAASSVSFDAPSRRQMAAAVRRRLSQTQPAATSFIWRRLALPFGFGVAGIALATLLMQEFVSTGTRRPLAPTARRATSAIHIEISYSEPVYTFRREGNTVIDSIAEDSLTAEETFRQER